MVRDGRLAAEAAPRQQRVDHEVSPGPPPRSKR